MVAISQSNAFYLLGNVQSDGIAFRGSTHGMEMCVVEWMVENSEDGWIFGLNSGVLRRVLFLMDVENRECV